MIRPPDPQDLRAFAERVVRLLDDHDIGYALCGSFAAMEYSEPRLSIDVDLMILARPAQVGEIVAAFERWGVYVTPIEVIVAELMPRGKPFNVIDGSSGAKADIYPVGATGLAGSAMQRRRQMVWDIDSGQTAWFLAPEDVILFKLMYYRVGGEIAQKHPTDIAKMLAVIGAEIDAEYLFLGAAWIGVLYLWRQLWRARGHA